MNQPLVTILVTCYNYEDYVAEAIESALTQTYANVEVVVINDGSTDNSDSVIRRFSDKIKLVSRENKGIVYTRNEGLRIAKGEYLFFLDADDYFDSDYVEKMVQIAEKNNADVVYPNWRVFGDKEYEKIFPSFTLGRLVRQEVHCTSESLIRLSAVGDNRFESKEVAEDWDFFIGLALKGCRFVNAKKCFINYRVRENTRSSQRSYWDDMRFFYSILKKWQRKYPDQIDPLDLPLYAGEVRDKHIAEQENIILEQNEALKHKDQIISDQSQAIQELKGVIAEHVREISELRSSMAYRVARKAAYPVRVARRMAGKVKEKTSTYREGRQKVARDQEIDAMYAAQIDKLSQKNIKGSKFAVVIHLFYTENWPLFHRKLMLLPSQDFDLFITMPSGNKSFESTIRKDFPEVTIIEAPNRGRDVLPFLYTATYLAKCGYETVLKFHSKKSTHWDGGQEWLETMLDQIIPEDKMVMRQIIMSVRNDKFGVLGPADVYYPLTINLPANRGHIIATVERIFDKDTALGSVMERRQELGFFGGTMFWVSMPAISELLQYTSARYFEQEAGQIDGTFAHAMERMFCLLPELKGLDIYRSDEDGVKKGSYQSDNIPEWSTDHER